MPHGAEQFKPNTTVAAIIHCQDKFLLVEELESQQAVFNQPAGHLEANESLISAIEREVFEETGLNVSPDHLSGIYYFHRPELNLYFLRFCFVFELQHPMISQPQDSEILATHWLTLAQIKAKSAQHRSTMVQTCIDDYLRGVNIPLSAIKSNL